MTRLFRLSIPLLAALVAVACSPQETPQKPADDQPGSTQQELTLLTEDYPPLSYRENGNISGQASAIVRAVAQELGESPVFKLVPWEQGMKETTDGPQTALYSTVLTQERKQQFQWVGPIGVLDTNLYALSDSSLSVNKLDDARKVDGIATVADYYSEEMLREKGFANLLSHQNEAQALQSLLDGSATLFASNNVTLPELLNKTNTEASTVRPVLTFSTDLTYLAFSPDVSKDRVTRWQQALDAMKKDGRFQAIYHKWLPASPAPGILQLVTEDYPPLTYREDGEVTGFVTDVVREIERRLDIDEPVRLTTWENAYNLAGIHPNVVLFSAERTADRENLFHWVGPVGSNKAILYARAGSDLVVDELNDARKVDAIATTSNWFTEQYLKEAGFTNLVSNPAPVDAVRRVMEGNATLTILTDSTVRQIVEQAGYILTDLQPVFTVMTTDYYIAMSRDTSQETVGRWQQALKEIQADGTLETLRKRYVTPD